MEDLLVLVDENDREIGWREKMEVHVAGKLHRAFSVFIFDRNQKKMLLQKRAEGKYHSGGLWSNACCSHPRKGEGMEAALSRRLKEELGFKAPALEILNNREKFLLKGNKYIDYAGKFQYFAQYDGLAEHEIDHVFLYYPSMEQLEQLHGNPEEVGELRWVSISELKDWMANRPEDFSAWFKPAFDLMSAVLKEEI